MIGMGSVVSQKVTAGPPVPAFDADYQAVLNYATAQGWTLPSALQQTTQNALVVALKAHGIWLKLHIFRVYATDGNNDFALINWKNPGTFNGVRTNSPTFISNQGFEGDGVSASINTPTYVLSANTQLNNWGGGAWIYRATVGNDGIFGVSQNGDFFRSNLHSNNFNESRIQQGNAGQGGQNSINTEGVGLRAIYRTGNTSGYIMVNNTSNAVPFAQSSGLSTGHLREIYRWNVWSNSIHSIAWFGEPLVSEHANLFESLNNYINSL